jgi:protein-L-isoaspartate(D-aspartate) O-methyltransferase
MNGPQWILLTLVSGWSLACASCGDEPVQGGNQLTSDDAAAGRDRPFDPRAAAMVSRQIERRGIDNDAVLAAMRRVPRHRFVPESLATKAYDDSPLPIGLGQTISQPYIVAFMTAALRLDGDAKVLEVGTGSGYQAAVLGEIAREVYTIEILPELAASAASILGELGYENIHGREGDGYRGWPEHAPFDAIMVTAAPDHIPQPLIEQLAFGGRMIIPVGDQSQDLILIEVTDAGVTKRSVLPVRFVPMTGEARQSADR